MVATYEIRCSDCICLVEENNQWYCDEYQKYCKDVTECGEWDYNSEFGTI